MTILRVHVAARWDPTRAQSWALYDADQRLLEEGIATSAGWPAHDALEIVLGAPGVRIIALSLPPLPAARVESAARFAVEDQIAAEAGSSTTHVAASAQARDGAVRAILTARDVVASLRPRPGPLAKLRRVIAEPELALPSETWRWCRGEDPATGFVRVPDGTAFAVSDPLPGGALPHELLLGLRAAPTESRTVRVEWVAEPSDLARWSHEADGSFIAAEPWRWQDAPAHAFAVATDLLQGDLALAPRRAAAPALVRVLAPAAWLLAIALGLHVLATLGEWVVLRIALWQAASQWQSLGIAAGLSGDALANADATRTALARRRAELLHAHRTFAPDDALPLLARASPAVRTLAAGAIRRVIYADGHWTMEIGAAGTTAAPALDQALRAADLDPLVVAVPNGLRVRFGAEP